MPVKAHVHWSRLVRYSSRCTVEGENAGTHTAMYSAPFWFRRAVADPLSRKRHDRLAGAHVEGRAFALDPQHPAQNDRDFLELRTLPGFLPPAG